MNEPLYRPIRIGTLELPGNIFLAPVAGYTDRAYRSVCAELGADFTYTELASSEALVREGAKTFTLCRRADNEKAYAIQLFGSEPDVMYKAAKLLEPFHPEAVDINCGCPVPKVVKTGAGSALMRNPALLGRIVEAVVRACREALNGAPVTVKMRSGWDSNSINYAECAAIAAQAGAAMVCLHPRTRAQGYSGKSNWLHIGDLVSGLKVPVAGSGDLFSPQDAQRMLEQTGCAAVMFARGAQGNPFIFGQTKNLLQKKAFAEPSVNERFAAAFKHLDLLAADIGETAACREMRRAFCAYTKGSGTAGGAKLRDRLVHAQTIADYREITGFTDNSK
ncbi:MAG: tRNA dihydrouridine synthase DusB [Treponema sp.]|nr:tRNA dihydrouridine synthase DusB [Treponema sp.]